MASEGTINIMTELSEDVAGSSTRGNVLLVDCDSVCVKIVSKMLCSFEYKVTTAKRAAEALRILREKENELDLILMEAHLPDMEMHPLLTHLERVSNLPIVMMSADNDSSTILESFSKGAVFYLVKPLVMNDIKNLWQFAYISKIDKMMAMEEVSGVSEESHIGDTDGVEFIMKMEMQGTMDTEDMEDDVDVLMMEKMLWTEELHEKFLKAVKELGIESAHPKDILEHMNVQGLKKEQVSSFLQKYHTALKNEHESIENTMRKRLLESGFATFDHQEGYRHYLTPEFMPSHGSVYPTIWADAGANGEPNFTHGQSTPVNCLPDSSRPDSSSCPDSSQFGSGNLVMGELPCSNVAEDINFEEFVEETKAVCNVEGCESSAAPQPTALNYPIQKQEEQILMPQQSSLPPPEPQGQEPLGGKREGDDEFVQECK